MNASKNLAVANHPTVGQLPYLTHLEHSIAPVSSIISYVSSLNPESISSKLDDEAYQLIPSLDAALSAADCQQAVVWRAFVHAHVGDLVVSITIETTIYATVEFTLAFSGSLFLFVLSKL